MQTMVSLACFRLENKFEDKETQLKLQDVHHMILENCGQCYRDSCGDCNSTETHKICVKNKCRRGKRYQPFTASSWRKFAAIGGHSLFPRDHRFLSLGTNQCKDPQKSVSEQASNNNSRFIVKLKELKEFFKLTDDKVIRDFLKADSCRRIADKYLIAMVFAYFKRADFKVKDYTRMNFFICLYLANDVEEDEEEIKYEIFPWVFGKKWKDKCVSFLKMRDLFLRRIDYKAIISRKCCDEIMAIEPDNSVWKRERPLHHGGAFRSYMKSPDDDGWPRGPKGSPRFCSECNAPDSQYDSASTTSTCWYVSSRDSSPNNSSAPSSTGDSSDALQVQDLRRTLPKDVNDDVWPTAEE